MGLLVGNCLVDANGGPVVGVCVRLVRVGVCGFVRCWDKPSAY